VEIQAICGIIIMKKNLKINAMETKTDLKKLTLLSEDIRYIMKTARNANVDMIRFCKDHPNTILHADKKPVLGITQDEFVRIFDLNAHHFFMPPEQVFRLGSYCELKFPEIIALVIKTQWEKFFAEMVGYMNKRKLNLGESLQNKDLVEKLLNEFKPDINQLMELAKREDFKPQSDFKEEHIEFLIKDLIDNGNFLYGNKQLREFYPENEITEKLLLSKSSSELKERYLKIKEEWNEKNLELEEYLFFLERKKRMNINIENQYYKIFNKIESERSGLIYQVEKYSIILEMLKEKPGLSYRELLKLAKEKLINAEKDRNEIRNKISRSLHCLGGNISIGSMPTVSAEFREKYLKACKKLLKKLFFLLHSDTAPNYSKLSKEKKTEINKLWLRLMKTSKNEMFSFSPTMLLYSMPDYELLEEIYYKACSILEIDPNSFDLEPANHLEFLISKGTSLEKVIEFLNEENERITLQLAHLELIQDEYTNERQAKQYRSALEDVDSFQEKMAKEINEFKMKITQLKKKISDHLNKIEHAK
jgi:hypothetical protein